MLKFHDWHGIPDSLPKVKSAEELQEVIDRYREQQQAKCDRGAINESDKKIRVAYFANMTAWVFNRRPYFSVYPKIVDALLRTKLDVPVSTLDIPTDTGTLIIRLAKGHELGGLINCIFAGVGGVTAVRDNGERQAVINIVCQRTDGMIENLVSVCDRDKPLEALASTDCEKTTTYITNNKANDMDSHLPLALRVVLGVCLLEKDPELIIPDVLDRDKARLLDNTIDPEVVLRLTERAHQRGKVGWIVGECTDEREGSEMSAHYRRGHWGFRWAGVGRSRLKWTKIKGSIIHRDRLTKVPTGYLDDEQK